VKEEFVKLLPKTTAAHSYTHLHVTIKQFNLIIFLQTSKPSTIKTYLHYWRLCSTSYQRILNLCYLHCQGHASPFTFLWDARNKFVGAGSNFLSKFSSKLWTSKRCPNFIFKLHKINSNTVLCYHWWKQCNTYQYSKTVLIDPGTSILTTIFV